MLLIESSLSTNISSFVSFLFVSLSPQAIICPPSSKEIIFFGISINFNILIISDFLYVFNMVCLKIGIFESLLISIINCIFLKQPQEDA